MYISHDYEIVAIFDRINKLDRDYSYWQILSLVYPQKYHVKLFSPY